MRIHFLSQDVQLQAKNWPSIIIGSAWVRISDSILSIKVKIGWKKKGSIQPVFEKIELSNDDILYLEPNQYKIGDLEPDYKVKAMIGRNDTG